MVAGGASTDDDVLLIVVLLAKIARVADEPAAVGLKEATVLNALQPIEEHDKGLGVRQDTRAQKPLLVGRMLRVTRN